MKEELHWQVAKTSLCADVHGLRFVGIKGKSWSLQFRASFCVRQEGLECSGMASAIEAHLHRSSVLSGMTCRAYVIGSLLTRDKYDVVVTPICHALGTLTKTVIRA